MTGRARADAPKRLWLLAVVAAVVVAGAWSSVHLRAEEAASPVRLGQGRPQLIEFGMGVCEQCKRMRPVMERARRELGGRVDVHVLDIRVEANDELARRFEMCVIPLTVLTDGTGRALWRHEGFVAYEVLARAVEARLAAAESACEPSEERCEP